ncbi:unnamed protein product, partial [marine sediment metagenome]
LQGGDFQVFQVFYQKGIDSGPGPLHSSGYTPF